MFLTEVTRTCLEAAKKDRDSNSNDFIMTGANYYKYKLQLVQEQYLILLHPVTLQPNLVTAVYNTSGTEMKRRIEDGKPNQAVTLFAPVGVAEDLSKTQYLLCMVKENKNLNY